MNANRAIRDNRVPILLVSGVYALGIYFSWQERQDGPGFGLDPILGVLTVSLCGLVLGMILGQRIQQLELSRPLSDGWAVSWRVALVWVGLAMLAEFLKTDATVTFTLDRLSPWIFLGSASILMSSFLLSYIGRIRQSDPDRVTLLEFLAKMSNADRIAAASVVVAIIGVGWNVANHPGLSMFPREKEGDRVVESAKDEAERDRAAAAKLQVDTDNRESDTGESQPGFLTEAGRFTESRLAGAGYSTSDPVVESEGTLADGEEAVVAEELALEPGIDYAFVGACDGRCGDLDLYLYSVAGGDTGGTELVAHDMLSDPLPIIMYSPSEPGEFRLEVKMYECSGSVPRGEGQNGEGMRCRWQARGYAR